MDFSNDKDVVNFILPATWTDNDVERVLTKFASNGLGLPVLIKREGAPLVISVADTMMTYDLSGVTVPISFGLANPNLAEKFALLEEQYKELEEKTASLKETTDTLVEQHQELEEIIASLKKQYESLQKQTDENTDAIATLRNEQATSKAAVRKQEEENEALLKKNEALLKEVAHLKAWQAMLRKQAETEEE